MVGGQGLLAVSTRAAIFVAGLALRVARHPTSCRWEPVCKRRLRSPLLLFQAAGTRRPASICRPFSDPNIRSRSGMTEGPICGCSISPIQGRALGLYLSDLTRARCSRRSPNSLAQITAPSRARGAMLLRQCFVDRACAQYVRVIPLSRGPGRRSRHFQTSRHTFIEASAQPPQPFGNPRRLDRPISQHDASPRLSLQREGANGNAEIKGS
jgi:hypothetical protein